MRIVGAVALLLSTGVTVLSVTTDRGFAATGDAAGRSATVAADAGAAVAFAEFAAAHPAYPVAAALGLFLVVVGDDAPLVG